MPRAILALLVGLSSALPVLAQMPRFGPSVVVELAGQTLGYTPARPVAPPPATPEPVAPEPQALPRPTLGIEGDRASGTTGCNQWTGTVSGSTRGAIRFGPIATTRMACSPALMAQEQAFLDALKRTTRAMRRGNELSLFPARGARLMLLRSFSARADQAPGGA